MISEWCMHGKWTVKDGKENQDCNICNWTKEPTHFVPNTKPFFNHGLGMVTNGTRDAEKKAKSMGLIPIGNERLKPNKEKRDTITPIIREGLKKIKNLGEY